MKIIKAAENFSRKDVEALNMATRMLLNIKENKIAERVSLMAKNGFVTLSLVKYASGHRKMICGNRMLVETVLHDCGFNYLGNDKFRFVTEKERKKPLLSIGKAFKEIRMELNLTQEHVAKRFNVSKSYISAIETGRQQLSICQAGRLAALFGMELSIILKRKGNSPLLEEKQDS
jgi:DNA-binding XRE family transcriptional regulator